MTCFLVGDELAFIELRVFSLVGVNAVLDLISKVPDETLNGPGGSVAERANGVSVDLEGKLFKHVDLSEISIAELHALEKVNHPTSTLSAGSALSTTLVLVELSQTQDRVDHICLFVHYNNCCSSKT